jgi:pimeloyl-ACP methyl ester carboxylesterase
MGDPVGDPMTRATGAEAAVTPFYFDAGGASLFVCHHVPRGRAREAVVVVCHPISAAYERAHRALRQLAVRLAERGFHTLRFDLSCCGDSAGESAHADVARWHEDVGAVVDLARARSGASAVCLVGVGIGAALATRTAARRADVTSLVLWEPVVNGSAYLADLETRHRGRLRLLPVLVDDSELAEPQALGFPLGETLRAGLAEIDLLGTEIRPGTRMLIVVDDDAPETTALCAAAAQAQAAVELQQSPNAGMWVEHLYRIVVPHQTVQLIADWMAKEIP